MRPLPLRAAEQLRTQLRTEAQGRHCRLPRAWLLGSTGSSYAWSQGRVRVLTKWRVGALRCVELELGCLRHVHVAAS